MVRQPPLYISNVRGDQPGKQSDSVTLYVKVTLFKACQASSIIYYLFSYGNIYKSDGLNSRLSHQNRNDLISWAAHPEQRPPNTQWPEDAQHLKDKLFLQR